MKVEDTLAQIDTFCNALSPLHPELSHKVLESSKGPFKGWFRDEVPAKGYSDKSGVYIFSNVESEVLYIGKAAADNFGAEIYSKFRAATKIDEDELPYFGNSPMAKWAPDGYAEYFLKGDVLISAVSVSPKDFASLLEVYLHVWLSINSSLPPLNKRIG